MFELYQSFMSALDAISSCGEWDKIILLTPAEELYPQIATRFSENIIICARKTSIKDLHSHLRKGDHSVCIPCKSKNIEDLLNLSIALSMAERILSYGDRVIFIGKALDRASLFIIFSKITENSHSEIYGIISDPGMPDPEVMKAVLMLALDLGQIRKRPAGALYVLGDTAEVLKYSSPLFMNPFECQPESKRNIKELWLRDTLKEYAHLDGAVVIDNKGVIQAAGVHINADTRNIDIPIEGTRHATAAAITQQTDSIAITVSEKTGTVTLFKSGKSILKVGP